MFCHDFDVNFHILTCITWKPSYGMFKQEWLWSACTYVQADQTHPFLHKQSKDPNKSIERKDMT